MEQIASYEQWRERCVALGYQGPHRLSGNPMGHQFLHPKGGTAAMWNAEKARGFIFAGSAGEGNG